MFSVISDYSEILRFMEKRTKRDNCSVNQKASNKWHDHGWYSNDFVMCQYYWENWTAKHQESSRESAKIDDSAIYNEETKDNNDWKKWNRLDKHAFYLASH